MIRRFIQLVRFVRVMMAARAIQDFLWGATPAERALSWETWIAACQKRIDRINGLERKNGSWKIEARKRLLQLATLSVSMMEWLDAGHGESEPKEAQQPPQHFYVDPFSGASWPTPWWPRA